MVIRIYQLPKCYIFGFKPSVNELASREWEIKRVGKWCYEKEVFDLFFLVIGYLFLSDFSLSSYSMSKNVIPYVMVCMICKLTLVDCWKWFFLIDSFIYVKFMLVD